MDGSFLRFYVHENDRLHGQLAWEWLLQQANDLGVRGGSAFRAVAGFGRHRVLHEERFFELAGSVTVEVEFIVDRRRGPAAARARRRGRGSRIFYARTPAHFGVIGGEPAR